MISYPFITRMILALFIMLQLKKKRKNKDLRKSRVITSCMMIKLIKNILREKKKKDKWLEEPLKLFSPKKASRNRSLSKISLLKLCLVEELSVLFFLFKEKRPKNSLPWSLLIKMISSKRIKFNTLKPKRWFYNTSIILS